MRGGRLLIGLVIGTILRLFLASLATAGEVVSLQTTLSFAQTANPAQAQPTATLAGRQTRPYAPTVTHPPCGASPCSNVSNETEDPGADMSTDTSFSKSYSSICSPSSIQPQSDSNSSSCAAKATELSAIENLDRTIDTPKPTSTARYSLAPLSSSDSAARDAALQI